MKKRTLSILLALALVVCLLPMAALAEDVTITDVSITGLTCPKAGETPDFDIVLPDEGFLPGYSVVWYDPVAATNLSSTDTFNPSQDYEAILSISPDTGYVFPSVVNDVTVAVDEAGYKIGISSINPSFMEIRLSYHVLDNAYSADPNGVSLLSTAPHVIAGGEKNFDDVASASAGATVTAVKWYADASEEALAADAAFSAGHDYTLCVTLAADDYTLFKSDLAVVYTLGSEDYSGEVTVAEDGKTADADFTFPALKGRLLDYKIGGITAPVAGEEQQTTGFTAEGDGFDVGYVRWAGTFDDGKFKAGEHYTLTLSLIAKDGYTLELSDKDAVTVNAGTVEKLGNDEKTMQPAVDIGFDVSETLTVTFDANGHGDAPAALTVASGKSVSETEGGADAAAIADVDGYHFAGWYTEAACENAYDLSAAVTRDITLYAKWVEAVTITFDAGDGAGTMEAVTVGKGDMYKLPDCTFSAPASKAFDKWDKGAAGEEIEVTEDLTLTALWKDRTNPFKDVAESDYFYNAVLWAFYHDPQITDGMTDTEFGPENIVTRGQAVTFLWRAMGKPEPVLKVNPFKDVPENEYYYKAVLWAVEKGITDGTSDTEFSPNQTLSTAHIATFLYRTVKETTGGWYQEAADWAVAEGLLDGINTMIAPDVDCPRGNVVTFLYRELK